MRDVAVVGCEAGDAHPGRLQPRPHRGDLSRGRAEPGLVLVLGQEVAVGGVAGRANRGDRRSSARWSLAARHTRTDTGRVRGTSPTACSVAAQGKVLPCRGTRVGEEAFADSGPTVPNGMAVSSETAAATAPTRA